MKRLHKDPMIGFAVIGKGLDLVEDAEGHPKDKQISDLANKAMEMIGHGPTYSARKIKHATALLRQAENLLKGGK